MKGIAKKIFLFIYYKFLYKLFSVLPDSMVIKLLFRVCTGKKLSTDKPTTFNEKLQWLKLYDRRPIYTTMVDKYKAKEYVAGIIGDEYIIPTIGAWDKAEEIDFSKLPQRFVLKCNHNSGLGMCICRDKNALSEKAVEKIRTGLKKGLKQNYYLVHREWPYKNVQRKVIAEQYIDTSDDDLPDYKFYCFNGKAKLILVCRNRFGKTGMTEDFFDESWRHLDISRPGHKNAKEAVQRPQRLEEMLALAEKLSKDIPFLRADFYYVNDRIYFGECTFFPTSGLSGFVPEEWDTILGDQIQLTGCAVDENKVIDH